MVDAVGDKKRRHNVYGVMDVAEQYYGREEYRGKQEEPLELVIDTPKCQGTEERHPRVSGEELVRAEEGVGNGRSKVA